jgi:hypothetical protein
VEIGHSSWVFATSDNTVFGQVTRFALGAIPDSPALFDLVEDPDEMSDLVAARPDEVTELRNVLEPWIAQGFLLPQKEPEHLRGKPSSG